MRSIKKTVAALFATALLSFGFAAPAGAANNSQQGGLVNVSVGDVSVLNGAHIGIAANVAATICGISVGPVAALAANTNQTGTTHTVCNTASGPVTLSQ